MSIPIGVGEAAEHLPFDHNPIFFLSEFMDILCEVVDMLRYGTSYQQAETCSLYSPAVPMCSMMPVSVNKELLSVTLHIVHYITRFCPLHHSSGTVM